MAMLHYKGRFRHAPAVRTSCTAPCCSLPASAASPAALQSLRSKYKLTVCVIWQLRIVHGLLIKIESAYS